MVISILKKSSGLQIFLESDRRSHLPSDTQVAITGLNHLWMWK